MSPAARREIGRRTAGGSRSLLTPPGPGAPPAAVAGPLAPDDVVASVRVDVDLAVIAVRERVAVDGLVGRAGSQVGDARGGGPGGASIRRPLLPGVPPGVAQDAIVLKDDPEVAGDGRVGRNHREAGVD